MILEAIFAVAASSTPGDKCREGKWGGIVRDTEALIVQRGTLKVPRDSVGTVYPAACVRVRFRIDAGGNPYDAAIDRSSMNRALDVAALDAMKGYQFATPKGGGNQGVFSLIFEIE